jgi:glycosyltransferase involved in cell wall biosynthesis
MLNIVSSEEKHIEATIDSIISQKARPQVWVIVDDGSSDKTWEIINSATISHSWIKGCRRHRETSRGNDGLLVASEAAAFLDGLRMALEACPRPDFIVKLDADLKLNTLRSCLTSLVPIRGLVSPGVLFMNTKAQV